MRKLAAFLALCLVVSACSAGTSLPGVGSVFVVEPALYPGAPQVQDRTFVASVSTEDILARVLDNATLDIRPTITNPPGVTINHLVPPSDHQSTTDATGIGTFALIPSEDFLQPRPYQYTLSIDHPSLISAATYTFSMPAYDANVHEILDLVPPNQPVRPYDQDGLFDTMVNLLREGANITLDEDDTANTITISSTGGGTGGSLEVQDDGTTVLSVATILNFAGAGVTVIDQTGGRARIEILGGGGGTTVVANPGGSPATNLNTVTIGATDYAIPAGGGTGTTVVANPGGSPSTDLDTVTIGTTDYDIPGEDVATWAVRHNIEIIPSSKLGTGTTNTRFLVGGTSDATWQPLFGATAGYVHTEDALMAIVSNEVAVVSGGTDGQVLSRSGDSFSWITPSGGSTPFDLHDDVTSSLTVLATADRMLATDESTTGDPMRYITYGNLREEMRPDWQSAGTVVNDDPNFINVTGGGATLTASGNGLELNVPSSTGGAFDLHDDVTNSLSVLSDADRLLVSDESTAGDPNRYIRFENLQEDIRPNWQVEGIFLVDSPDFINVLGGATFTVSGGGLNMTIPSGGGTGTTVVANPGGSPATNLSTVTIGTMDYAIPSGGGTGTTVVANPGGSPSTNSERRSLLVLMIMRSRLGVLLLILFH